MIRWNVIRRKAAVGFLAAAFAFTLMEGDSHPLSVSYATEQESLVIQSGTEGDASVIQSGTEGEVTDTTDYTTVSETTNTDENGILGKNSDVSLSMKDSVTGTIGKKVKFSFKVKATDAGTTRLKNVYPVVDSSFPFETSGDAYKVVSAGDDAEKQAKLSTSYTLKSRSDLSEGYQSVRFMIEYSKTAEDGSAADYYVVKTINIYLKDPNAGKEDTSDEGGSASSSADDSEVEKEVATPKLIIEGFDTNPEKVMAGSTFTMTIHIKNSSKTTSVCNGKFLIGDESGNFLPTSGSNAVYVEKIAPEEVGDLEIELKTSADLPQKNYRLMVKGDFDDGDGTNFTASESVYLSVYQEVKLNITDVTMTPESIGIGSSGSLVFTINNQGSAGVYNVKVSTDSEAVTAPESYVGNIAGNASAYATLEVTGQEDNTENGTIKVTVSYEDSEGTEGKYEQDIACKVGVDEVVSGDDYEDYDDFYYDDEDFYEDDEEGIPWWVWLIVGIVALIVIVVIVIIVVVRRKKKLAALMEDEDDFLENDGESVNASGEADADSEETFDEASDQQDALVQSEGMFGEEDEE